MTAPPVVTCLRTGNVRPKRRSRGLRRYLPGGWADQTLPVHAFLIEHPAGLCLFDVGQTARAATPGYLPRWHPFLRLARFELSHTDEAASLLRAGGFDPDGVRWIVLSHLHTDHVGTVGAFPRAEVIVSRVEWSRAIGLAGRVRGYLPQHWPSSLHPRLIDLSGDPWGPFPASLDLAGDGRLVVVPAPGHTPGHLALIVDVGTSRYLLAGDAGHRASDVRAGTGPLADFSRRPDVVVLTAHDHDAERLLQNLGAVPHAAGGDG